MEALQILLAHLPHHLLSIHICGDELAVLANAMPQVEGFLFRVLGWHSARKCAHHSH